MKFLIEEFKLNEEFLLENLIKEDEEINKPKYRGQKELKEVVSNIVSYYENIPIDTTKSFIHHIDKKHENNDFRNISLICPIEETTIQKAHGIFHRKDNNLNTIRHISNNGTDEDDYNFTIYFLKDYVGKRSYTSGPRNIKVK